MESKAVFVKTGFYEALRELPRYRAMRTLWAIMELAFDGEPPRFDDPEKWGYAGPEFRSAFYALAYGIAGIDKDEIDALEAEAEVLEEGSDGGDF